MIVENSDMVELTGLQQNYNHGITQVGLLRLEYRRTENQLLNHLAKIQKDQNEIIKKYGDGSINLDTGEFTPNPEVEAKAEMPKLPKLPKRKKTDNEISDKLTKNKKEN